MKRGTVYKINPDDPGENKPAELWYLIVKDAGTDNHHGEEKIVVKFKALSKEMKFNCEWRDKLVSLPLDSFIGFVKNDVLIEAEESDIAKLLLVGINPNEI